MANKRGRGSSSAAIARKANVKEMRVSKLNLNMQTNLLLHIHNKKVNLTGSSCVRANK